MLRHMKKYEEEYLSAKHLSNILQEGDKCYCLQLLMFGDQSSTNYEDK